MTGFEYPASPHARRHGPGGYKDYSSYRDWLRDEFTFRCVFCLHRELWEIRGETFHVEHFCPTSVNPDGECEYSNLLYACPTCNKAKEAVLGLPDPCAVAFGDCLLVKTDGHVEALTSDGEKLKQVLKLDSATNVRNRYRWMRILETLRTSDPALYQELMSFPQDLPDLRAKRVPENTRPDGVVNCYFVLKELGKLPPVY
jgi:hypothetical protein